MKKIIYICFLAVFMLMSAAGAYAEGDSLLTQRQTEALSLMNDLGIFQNVRETEALNTITRAEFAKITVRVMGEEALPAATKRIFADVLTESDAAGSIEYLYERSIMRGYGNAEFHPDEEIILDQVVTVMVSVLGYSGWAENKGGYSDGYYKIALSNDVLNGITREGADKVTYADAAVIIQNVLENDGYLVIAGFKNETPVQEQAKGEAYMGHMLDTYMYTGVLEAYGDTALSDPGAEYRSSTCVIDGETYDKGDMDVEQYLGMKVKVYYKYDGDEAHILHIIPDHANSVIDADGKDISGETGKSSFVYYVNKSKKHAVISSEAVFIYNGKKLDVVTDSDLCPADGSVRLISNDGDNKYDVVIIKDYDTFIVDKAVAAEEVVYFKYGRGSMELEEGKGYKAKYFTDGEPTDFTSITTGSVLSIARSKNTIGEILAYVYISNEIVTGTAVSADNGDEYSVVMEDGTEYKLTAEYKRRLAEGDVNTYEPTLGSEGRFYIDYFGRLAAYTLNVASKNYGYMVKCWYDKDEETGAVRLFTKDGVFEDLDLPENVIVNGVRVAKAALPDKLKETGENGTVYQLVVYSANASGVLTKLQTATDKTSEKYYVASEDEFILNSHPVSDTGSAVQVRFYKNMAEYHPYHFETGKTLHFMIPTDRGNEKMFKVATKLSTTDVYMPAPVYIYDAGAGGAVGVVISNAATEGEFGDPRIVDSVGEALDDEGTVGLCINFVGGGSVFVGDDVIYDQPVNKPAPNENRWSERVDYSGVTVSDLKRGDVIEYTTANGMLETLRVLVKVDNIGKVRVERDHLDKNGNMIADVISVADSGKVATVYYVDRYGQDQYQAMHINSTVYKYDSSDKKVYVSSPSDIRAGDRILINSFWWSPKLVVIFR